ncbi:glycoside hydrolase family 18 protein [Gramella sp. KN1008]|nr:glycoside hydrolase family 18 protein [Gramella sp. KN1008]
MITLFSSCLSGVSGKKANNQTPSTKDDFKVIGYWPGSNKKIDTGSIKQLDQIIYSFLHLKGTKLQVSPEDAVHLEYLVGLKKINPELEVLISLGGWGGCETCSDVFSTESGRMDFAKSVKNIMEKYDAQGIDLDWEYPAIRGYEGHAFKPEDRENFTLLIQDLRNVLGPEAVISFAAGSFKDYLEKSVDWAEVMPLVDHVNLMTYDMFNGGSSTTGHHTSLYPNEYQKNSAHFTINYLDSLGVPKEKMVLGAAFYARVWEEVNDSMNGLYQVGKFKESILYKDIEAYKKNHSGFEYFYDSVAQAPYLYNASEKLFATYDDSSSITSKTKYALDHNLGGIMFWQLSGDNTDGLLDIIDEVIIEHNK